MRNPVGAVAAAGVLALLACGSPVQEEAPGTRVPAPEADPAQRESVPAPPARSGPTEQEEAAASLLREGRVAEAEAAFRESLEVHGPTPRALEGIARILDWRGDLEAAHAGMRELAEAYPESFEAQRYLAYFCQRTFRELEGGAVMRRAVELRPEDLPSLRQYAAFCLNTGRYEDCLEVLERAAARSDDLALWNSLGVVQLRAGHTAEAAETFRKGLELHPDDPLLKANLGRTLVATGAHEEAGALLEEVLRSSPRSSVALFALARVRYAEGRSEEGDALMERFKEAQIAVDVQSMLRNGVPEPATTDAAVRMGETLERYGDRRRAVKYYERALQMDPARADAKDGLRRLTGAN